MHTRRREPEEIEKELKEAELVLKNTYSVELSIESFKSIIAQLVQDKVTEYVKLRFQDWHPSDLVELLGALEDEKPEEKPPEPKRRGRPKLTKMAKDMN